MPTYKPAVTFTATTRLKDADGKSRIAFGVMVDGKRVLTVSKRPSFQYSYWSVWVDNEDSHPGLTLTANEAVVKAMTMKEAKQIIKRDLEGE